MGRESNGERQPGLTAAKIYRSITLLPLHAASPGPHLLLDAARLRVCRVCLRIRLWRPRLRRLLSPQSRSLMQWTVVQPGAMQAAGVKQLAALGTVLSGSGCWSAATRLRCSGFIVFLYLPTGAATGARLTPTGLSSCAGLTCAQNSTERDCCQNDVPRPAGREQFCVYTRTNIEQLDRLFSGF